MRTRALGTFGVLVVLGASTAVVGLAARAAGAQAPASTPPPETVTADMLPTTQVNGVVWDQVIVGERVYATGEFSTARPAGAPPGTSGIPRANLLAYDLHTGVLIADWAPTLNAQGHVIGASDDGSTIYVGGDFTVANGQDRRRLVALDASSGALVSGFAPDVNGRVAAMDVDGSTLYIGGAFTSVNGAPRNRLAALDAADGAPSAWAPIANRDVVGIVAPSGSGRVVVSGTFSTLNFTQQWGMGALDAMTGAVLPWPVNTIIKNRGSGSYISSLDSDGTLVFGSATAFQVQFPDAGFEGHFAADLATGQLVWITGCRGDGYDVAVSGEVLYWVGHSHDCGMLDANPSVDPLHYQRAQALRAAGSPDGLTNAISPNEAWWPHEGRPATEILHWLPHPSSGFYTGQFQGPWTVEANDDYVVLGGEFPRVNDIPQQGLVRFAKRHLAPGTDPLQGYPELQPVVTPLGPGTVRIAWTAAWDRDDERLRFDVLRGTPTGSPGMVHTFETTGTTWWHRPPLGYVDTTASPGSTYTYRIRVTDPHGNGVVGPPTTVTIPGGAPPVDTYRATVTSDRPQHYWRLDEIPGVIAGYDWASADDLRVSFSAKRWLDGALEGVAPEGFGANPATHWWGTPSTATVQAVSQYLTSGPQVFSVEAWFRTTSTKGGKLVGFGDSLWWRSDTNRTDRHVYMSDDGRLLFGVRPDMGTRRVVASPGSYNDGEWHHVVAGLGPAGMVLYVDGEVVASDPSVTKAQIYRGYWRVAGDRLTFWPDAPTHEALGATIDEVAIYPYVLGADRVLAHYLASGRVPGLRPEGEPAAFGSGQDAGDDPGEVGPPDDSGDGADGDLAGPDVGDPGRRVRAPK